jgi:glycerol-3-phosphate acyltransferase PlsY
MPLLSALLLSAVVGYLCGSIPFGLIAGRLRGIDIRKHGSGNIGATNVVRVMGKAWGVPVFVLDFFKGFGPVCYAAGLATGEGGGSTLAVVAALSSVLGHLFPCWLGFRGGKGVATTAGALLALTPVGVGIGLLVWVVTLRIWGFVSLASILAGFAVALGLACQMALSGRWDAVLLGFSAVVALLVFLRHRGNLQRIAAGTEPKVWRRA